MSYLSNAHIGQAIIASRKKLRLSGRELAARLDVHPSMVTRWEKGQMYPTDEMLKRLATALETTVESLVRSGSTLGEAHAKAELDAEFLTLLNQIPTLEPGDREAVRAILKALLMKNRVQDMVGSVIGKAG